MQMARVKAHPARSRRALLACVAVAALGITFAGTANAANTNSKPGVGAASVSQRAVPADGSAGRFTPALSPAVRQMSATVRDRIMNYVRTNGTRYTWGSYADRATGKVVVETDAPSSVVSSLVGTLGTTVDVRRTAPVTDQFNRRDDVTPYWGGAGVALTAGVPQCSDGYTVQDSSGSQFMVTAGHCFSNGATAVTETSGLFVGTVSGNGLPSMDMELIGGSSYAPFIYNGGVTSTTSWHIASAADPVVGFNNYCHSGRTTGENCGHTDIDNNATVCTSSGCKSPVTAFQGGNLPQGGDSGSPYYVGSTSGDDKHIRGHVIAGDGTTEYAEMWSRVAARFGVSIVS
jgi:hypothetical protein